MKKAVILLVAAIFSFGAAGSAMAIEFDEMGSVDIHGFVSQGYLKSDENNFLAETEDGTFEFSELGVNFSTDVTDQLRLGLQLISTDLGGIGNDEVRLDWAFADYRWTDRLGFRAGKIKIPHGYYNETRDVDSLRTSVLMPQGVYNDAWRDSTSALKGIGIYGDIDLSFLGSLSYQVQGGTVEMDEDGGYATNLESKGKDNWLNLTAESVDVEYTYVTSIDWSTPLDGLRIGGSYIGVKATTEIVETQQAWEFKKIDITVASAEYTVGNLIMAAEYMYVDMDSSYDYLTAFVGDNDTSIEREGYYGSASYRFTEWFELGAYYSVYYPDKNDKDGDDLAAAGLEKHRAWIKDIAISTRFDLNENWVFKLEGHIMDGAAIMYGQDNSTGVYTSEGFNSPLNSANTYKVTTEEDWYLLAAKMTFNF